MKNELNPSSIIADSQILGGILTVGGLIVGSRKVSDQISDIIGQASDEIKSILTQINNDLQYLISGLEKTYQNNLNITINSLDNAIQNQLNRIERQLYDVNQMIQEDIKLVSKEAQDVIKKAGEEVRDSIKKLEQSIKNTIIIGSESLVYVVDRITNLIILIVSIIGLGASAILFALQLIKYGLPDGFARTLVLILISVAIVFFGLMLIPSLRVRLMAYTGWGLKKRLELLDLGNEPTILGIIPECIVRNKTYQLIIIGANLFPKGTVPTVKIDNHNIPIIAKDSETIVLNIPNFFTRTSNTFVTLELYYDNTKGPSKVISIKQPSEIKRPDLKITKFEIDPNPPIKGKAATATIKIKNIGDGNADGLFNVLWQARTDTQGSYKDKNITNGLKAGAEKELQFTYEYTKGGKVESKAIIDPDSRITNDENRSNNERSMSFTIKELPDTMDYKVMIKTGDVEDAGTSANVHITLYGDEGKSKRTELDTPNHNDFERGQKDTFTIESDYLGNLTQIKVEHDNTDDRPGWYINYIDVEEKMKVDGKIHKWHFKVNGWLALDEYPNLISRIFEPDK